MEDPKEPAPRLPSGALFPTTHWTVVLEAGDGATAASSQALEELCRTYWTPLYAYLRRQGHSPHDAQDLTQGFLTRVIAREDIGTVDPEKGRFRTFLLTGLRNYTIKQALRDKASKRGGGQATLSIDTHEAERLCGPDVAAENPELAFDRRWCRTVISRSIQRLRDEHHARGKQALFDTLARFLDGADPGEYVAVAAELGMAPGTVAVAIHRLRSRLQELVRAEIMQTVGSAKHVEEETRYLMQVWQR
jgi:RNA polymerase sigma factor (sigma-70 family)